MRGKVGEGRHARLALTAKTSAEMASSFPDKYATPSRPSALPSLLAGLRTPSSASVASTSTSTTAQESLSHGSARTPGAHQSGRGSRSPSMRSLAEAAASSVPGGVRASRTMRSFPGLSRTANDMADAEKRGSTRGEGATRSRSSSSSSAGSRASSASSLEGLAQRLQGARKGKGKGVPEEGKLPTLETPEAVEEGESAPQFAATTTHAPAVTSTINSVASYSSSPSTSTHLFDIPRTCSPPDPPEPSASTAEASDDASFAHDDAQSEDDADDVGDDDSAFVIFRSEGQPDPRDMLRAQLARAPPSTMSVEQRRWSEKGKEKAVDAKEVDSRPASREDALTNLPRRYFILSTAGKLIYTS